MLKIHLFGTGSAHFGEIPLAGFPRQQAGLLLCYLLLNSSQPQSRERLAAVFWEDLPAVKARKYLRNGLWRLKKSLSRAGAQPRHFLRITTEHVAVSGADDLWVDVDDFERVVRNSQKTGPEALSLVQVQELEAAAELYTGDLLSGIYADWTLYDRERLRLAYLGIRQKLMLHHGTYGRFTEALDHGERILAIDPAREKIHRQMMRFYAHNGDRNSAMAQYKRCKQILQDELNLPPMRETRQLYRLIKNNQFDRDQPAIERASSPNSGVLNRLHSLQRLANRIHAELRTLEKLLNADR